MTKPLTQIPDIAYAIDGDLIKIEQSTGCGEFTYVDLHKIHIQLLAEQMLSVKPVHVADMSEVVEAEMSELFWALEDHWQSVCKDSRMDIDHMTDSKNLYNKLYSILRLMGLDPDLLSNLENSSDKPIYPPPTFPKDNSVTPKPKANVQSKQGSLV